MLPFAPRNLVQSGNLRSVRHWPSFHAFPNPQRYREDLAPCGPLAVLPLLVAHGQVGHEANAGVRKALFRD